MKDERNASMVSKLLKSTSDGGLQWEKTPEGTRFQIAIKDYVLSIKEEPFEEGTLYLLYINNSDGDLVDEIGWKDLEGLTGNESPRTVLWRLYNMARRNAMGADKAINDITSALDMMGTPTGSNVPSSKPTVDAPKPKPPSAPDEEDDVPF
jgi:hypothetical protein